MLETQFSNKTNQEGSLQQAFGLIQTLDHRKIIKMKQFDPSQLIEQRFTKGQETIFDMQNLQKQRLLSKQQSSKIQNPDQLLILKSNDYSNFNSTQNNIPEYFTIQATPINSNSRVNLHLEADLIKENMNRTQKNLIKIEDDYDGHDFDDSRIINPDKLIQEESDENSSSEKEEAGFLGFFKKTFSSVKKTFESTFNPNNDKQVKSKSQQRPPALSTYSQTRPGLYTPDLMFDEQPKHCNYMPIKSFLSMQEEESPEITGNRRNSNQQKAQNRAARSQTFHVNQSIKQPVILVSESQQQPPKRDRKNNNSFLQNLWNLGSTRKQKPDNHETVERKIGSLSPVKPSEDQKILIQKKNKNRTLNGSGFFIFNEEDMKNMTEMSPSNIYKQSSTATNQVGQIQILKFDYQQLEGQRQQPRIKNPPILDQQQNNLLNRLRSISYQNDQTRQVISNQNSGSKRVKLFDELRSSLTQQKLSEEQYLNYKTTNNAELNRQTFAINSQGFSPIQVENSSESRNQKFKDQQQQILAQHIVFNLDDIKPQNVLSFQQTPKLASQSSQKQKECKDEFEQLYKKSTENLLYAPQTLLTKNSSKDNLHINKWKSQTSKISLKNSTAAGGAAQKPPKHHYQVVKKNINGYSRQQTEQIVTLNSIYEDKLRKQFQKRE